MRDDQLSNLGRDIGRAVRNVLNSKDFDDLKHSIDDAVRNIGNSTSRPPYGQNPRYTPPFQNQGTDHSTGSHQQGPQPGTKNPPPPPGWNQWSQRSYQKPPFQSYRPPYQPPFAGYQKPAGRDKQNALMGAFLLVLGILFTIMFSFLVLWCVYCFIVGMMDSLSPLLVVFPLLIVSLVVSFRGSHLWDKSKRFRSYQRILQGRSYCSIKELADGVGMSVEFVAKDLQKMISQKFFPQGHLDEQKTCLMTDEATYQQYLETQKNLKEREEEERKKKELWEKDPAAAALQQMIEEGMGYRDQIRAANDAIPGEIISLKLDRLEQVTTKIFEYVEAHPQKQPDIRKFMSYYMPITLKLVNAYKDFDSQPVQGENILSAKKEIEETLDTINLAFENLLDGLFEDDALDISTDISALETMLAQEGLTGEKFGSQ